MAGAAGLLAPLPAFAATTARPTAAVETTLGRVRGLREGGISRFLGIPYGADTGQHRFQPPRPAPPWNGLRECRTAGAQAPQGPIMLSGPQFPPAPGGPGLPIVMKVAGTTAPDIPESEDCLFLNVWTPDASPMRKRPVMVWLHGGGFASGTGLNAMTDGTALARRGDVVVVSLNHRLNALGYLYLGALHDDFADSGNAGVLDIVLALQWVRDNIAGFGGDPGSVTIFGESGGGAKVGAMMAMAPARGLFHKAIVQSGPTVNLARIEDAARIAEQTLAALGLARRDVHKLQGMERQAIIRAASAVRLPGTVPHIARRALAPLVDGRSIPADPFDPAASELAREVPMMIGTCKDEWTLFLATDGMFARMDAAEARRRFAAYGPRAEAAFEVYRSLRPDDPPGYWLSSMVTDIIMRSNSILQADRKAAQGGAPVFMYRVDFEPRVAGRLLRSPHGTDVPLMFGNPVPREFIGAGPEVGMLTGRMMQAWINFARSGNPSQRGLAWPRYERDRRLTMIFDAPCAVRPDPDRVTREFWSAQPLV